MRVVVVGLGKSGTTAVLYAVKSAMPDGTKVLFEPRSYVQLDSPNVAAKVLLHPKVAMDYAFYRQFDRIVLLVRDPRDIQISRALYRAYGARALLANRENLARYVELLRAKEAQPRSVSLTRINTLFLSQGGSELHSAAGLARMLDDAMAFHDAFPECFVFRYEEMVEGRFGTLAQYLSLPMDAMKPEVPDAYGRVVRSRRAGNWRDWFCPEDVELYRPVLSAYMSRYGYDDDWRLNADPAIRPEECSEYVLRIVGERLGTAAVDGI
jgi:hypothetical protein